ncbi:hypothetical protein HMI54_010310 [Coelomomyces lativittatus]|nr:hypothetical protein HMI54_010310 [Coelomomyces lativittatus]
MEGQKTLHIPLFAKGFGSSSSSSSSSSMATTWVMKHGQERATHPLDLTRSLKKKNMKPFEATAPSTSSSSSSIPWTFLVHPFRFSLLPGQTQRVEVSAYHAHSGLKTDLLQCKTTLETEPTRVCILEMHLQAHFFHPWTKLSPSPVRFTLIHTEDQPLPHVLAQSLRLENCTQLPLPLHAT